MSDPSSVGEPPSGAASRTTGRDRVGALAAPPPPIPRRFVRWAIAAVVVLGGGGELIEHILDSHGIPSFSVSATSPTVASASSGGGARPTAHHVSMTVFMGASRLGGALAPDFQLIDQRGQALDLAGLRGRVVVLAFVDAACDDICPVLLPELRRANADLGADASRVAFVAINTDPLVTSVASVRATTSHEGLSSTGNWYFVTAGLGVLDPVWTSYGITVEVGRASHKVAHTDVLYFLDASGRERERATPFANETRTGVESLPAATAGQFAADVAAYARQLLLSGKGR